MVCADKNRHQRHQLVILMKNLIGKASDRDAKYLRMKYFGTTPLVGEILLRLLGLEAAKKSSFYFTLSLSSDEGGFKRCVCSSLSPQLMF